MFHAPNTLFHSPSWRWWARLAGNCLNTLRVEVPITDVRYTSAEFSICMRLRVRNAGRPVLIWRVCRWAAYIGSRSIGSQDRRAQRGGGRQALQPAESSHLTVLGYVISPYVKERSNSDIFEMSLSWDACRLPFRGQLRFRLRFCRTTSSTLLDLLSAGRCNYAR